MGTANYYQPSPETHERVHEILRGLPKHGLEGLAAVVVGAGKSGRAAATLLVEEGAAVTVVDDRPPADFGPGGAVVPFTREALEGADLVILSPGVPRTRPELEDALRRGVVVGEIELASWFLSVPLIGITGTNGKSTTTALTGHLFREAGLRVFTGGNLGRPLTDLVLSNAPEDQHLDVAVVELSSYQLESLVEARFAVTAWLNLTPDHTDRYPSHAHYGAAKRRLLELGKSDAVAVLNADDPVVVAAGLACGGTQRWFSLDPHAVLATKSGTRFVEADRAERISAEGIEVYTLANATLPGAHNIANMAAAIECVRAMGVRPAVVQGGLTRFQGLPHRIELVEEFGGVHWYNDSKATNVDSAITAVRALAAPKVLIAGGRDKGAPWQPLVAEAQRHAVKAVLAIGEASDLVLAAFAGQVAVEACGDLAGAVRRAAVLAAPGDAVLLSPACASFDQFQNYEHRGNTFRALVRALAESQP